MAITNDKVEGVTLEYELVGKSRRIDLDVTPVQDHGSQAQATEHPVERGADPADHVHIKARTLKLQVINSDLPEKHPDHGRAQAIYETLLGLQRTATLLTVYTSQGLYRNMAIEGLDSTRNSATGKAVPLAISLKQIRTVRSQHVKVGTLSPLARQKDSSGPQVAQPTTLTAEQRKSILLHTIEAGGKAIDRIVGGL
jgi:hypothetical protein